MRDGEYRMISNTAQLSNSGKYTIFSYNGQDIRFRSSSRLLRYISVKEWDHGYLVVDADYSTLGITEEYIDLSEVLDDLYIDKDRFLAPIKEVVIQESR